MPPNCPIFDNFHDARIRAILDSQVAGTRTLDAMQNALRIWLTDDASHTHDDFALWNHDPFHAGGYHQHDDSDHRQLGGPVSAGQRNELAEHGPEMFVPSHSGRIELERV